MIFNKVYSTLTVCQNARSKQNLPLYTVGQVCLVLRMLSKQQSLSVDLISLGELLAAKLNELVPELGQNLVLSELENLATLFQRQSVELCLDQGLADSDQLPWPAL